MPTLREQRAAAKKAREEAAAAAAAAAARVVMNNHIHLDGGNNHNNNNAPAPVLPAAASVPVRALAAAVDNSSEEAKVETEDVAIQPGKEKAADDDMGAILKVLQQMRSEHRNAIEDMRMEMEDIRAGQANTPSTSSFSITPLNVEGVRAAAVQPQPSAASASTTSESLRKKVKYSDVKDFSGEEEDDALDRWIDKLQSVSEFNELQPRETIILAATHMTDAALTWWKGMPKEEKAAIVDITSLAKAIRERFQPIEAEETARDALDSLRQGNKSTNEYIKQFNHLHAKLPDMSAKDALHAFMRGLKKDLYSTLRVQGVKDVREAIQKAAQVSGLTTQAHHASPANALTGIFPKDDNTSTTQQQYPRNNTRGYRGGRGGGRAPFNRGAEGQQRAPPTTAPLIPQEVREKRREQGACFRCGQSGHMARACPNAVSVSLN
jgi:hypothetical protein